MNKFLEGYLRCFVSNKEAQWVKWIPLIEWWYNTSFHTAAKMTPFMALYGYHPSSITSFLRGNSRVQAMEDQIEHQQEQGDQHRSERSFDMGDWVFLWLT